MRASWTSMLRVCREVAYGIDSMTAIRHGRQPGVPPYLPPSLFNASAMTSPGVVRRLPPGRD
jgi:hypothetical protein